MAKKTEYDVLVSGSGTIYLVHGVSEAGKQWMNDHLPADAQHMGQAVAVEHRYIEDIVEGMRNDGLSVGANY